MGDNYPYNFTGQNVSGAPIGAVNVTFVPVTQANTAAMLALQAGILVPGIEPVAGLGYHMNGWGNYSDTGTPTLSFRTSLGPTVLATVAPITLGAGVTAVPFAYDAYVVYDSPTTVQAVINLSLGTNAATGAASVFVACAPAAVTVPAGGGGLLTMSVQFSAAAPANTITLLGGFIERIS